MDMIGIIKKLKRIHTNRDYWIPKIEKNMAKDKQVNEELRNMGWIVIRFWEKHEVLKNINECVLEVKEAIALRKQFEDEV